MTFDSGRVLVEGNEAISVADTNGPFIIWESGGRTGRNCWMIVSDDWPFAALKEVP